MTTEPIKEMKRDLYRLAIARSDIAAAMEGCDYLLREEVGVESDLYWTLHNGIVVSYCRPFTRNRPYGPLDAKWSEFDDPELGALHRELIDLTQPVRRPQRLRPAEGLHRPGRCQGVRDRPKGRGDGNGRAELGHAA